ncbi:MAG: rhomboid family intramembrane serine protease [Bacteroidales bacterium]|nr:rhomboid family intramembrane serine protease [Bacteroidales bacterium]
MNYSSYNKPQNSLEQFKQFFKQGSTLSTLILVNVGVWVFFQILKVFLFLFNGPDNPFMGTWVIHHFAVPASIPVLITKPWTLVTYMFLHIEFWHILFNMLWLYWFGKMFLEFLTSRQLLSVYFWGGIVGGLVYVLSFNIFPVFNAAVNASYALGASASVMAIVTAISFYSPTYSIQLLFLGRVRILYLAIILFVSDFFMIPSGNAGGHIAHIGGALFGIIYILSVKKVKQKNEFRKSSFSPTQRPFTDEEFNIHKKENQKRIDDILEKISKGGYDSLTKAEKDFLFKTSNKKQ